MSATYAAVTAAMDAAVVSLGNGDYAAARDKALAAQAILSILPDTSRNTSGGGSDGVTWDRVAVSQFVDRVTKLANISLGVQVQKVQTQPLLGVGVNQIGLY
jgi:hypothetical protein